MKRQLFLKDEKGFTLPIVLILSSFIFFYLSFGFLTYKQEIKMTETLIQSLKAQTLYEIGYKKYKHQKLTQDNNMIDRIFQFPDGEVDITTLQEQDNIYLYFEITTNEGFYYAVTKSLKLDTTHETVDDYLYDNGIPL